VHFKVTEEEVMNKTLFIWFLSALIVPLFLAAPGA
jgi:hypothetical protein